MRKLIILSVFFLSACSTTERVEYIDREVLVPDVRIESCITETIEKECSRKKETYRDLVSCYIELKDKIDRINNIIEQCNNQNIRV